MARGPFLSITSAGVVGYYVPYYWFPMTRSFDTTDTNVVTTAGGQRVHAGHAAQSEVLTAGFTEVRKGVWNFVGNGLSNQSFIEAPEGIIAIDTGESIEEMREALRR